MFSTAPIITETGLGLLLRAAAGEQFTLTKFQVGKGFLDSGEDPKKRTALKSLEIDDLAITQAAYTPGDDYIKLGGSFNNEDDVTEDFTWTELGVIAEDEDGVEYLYAYGYDGVNCEMLSPGDGTVKLMQAINVILAVGETENITANVIMDATYASKSALDAHLADHNDPHHVLPSQIGAAPAVHNHAASDINSGVLPPSHGGTGVTSIAALDALIGGRVEMGKFLGNGANRQDITLGFKPQFVVIFNNMTGNEYYDGINNYQAAWLIFEGNCFYTPNSGAYHEMTADQLFALGHGGAAVTDTGFAVGYDNNDSMKFLNTNGRYFTYLALKPEG